MAVDLLGTHRTLSALLESEGGANTRGLKTQYSFQKLNGVLLKASAQNFLNALSAEPMDKFSKQGSRGSVRKTIMEHEEIFRQQVHELHRLYRVQKSLMAELGNKNLNFHSPSEETQRMVQDPLTRLKNSASTSENSQSSRLSPAQYSTPRQVCEHLFLQECNPRPSLSLFGEETSRTQMSFDLARRVEDHKSVEGDNWSTRAGSDLDLTLSIGPSSRAMKTRH